MGYYSLSSKNGELALAILRESGQPDWDDLVGTKGSPPFPTFQDLKSDVDDLREQYTFPLPQGQAARFEGDIGILLHQVIQEGEMAGDPDFWRWLCFCPLLEALLDRHITTKHPFPSKANFGLGLLVENFAYRAWLRAEVGYDHASAPSERYRLARRGDQDLWRSHVFRIRYGIHREMAHALVEFQFPDDSGEPFLKTGDPGDGIRMLAKRVARTHANLAIPALNKDECLCLIRQLADGLTKSDGTKFFSSGVI